MKLFAFTLSLLLWSANSEKFDVKIKDPFVAKEGDQRISVDLRNGSEKITYDGQTSLKDFSTGYAAIKADNKVCYIYKHSESGQKTDVANIEKGLKKVQAGDVTPQVVAEMSETITNTTEVTPEESAEIGQKLVEFCSHYKMVLILEPSDDDDDDDDEDGSDDVDDLGSMDDAINTVKRMKRRACRQVRKKICLGHTFVRVADVVKYCCKKRWWKCRRRCTKYNYRMQQKPACFYVENMVC